MSYAAFSLSLLTLSLCGQHARAADQPILECAAVVDPTARLACYDRLAGATKPADEKHPAEAAAPPAILIPQAPALITSEPSPMSRIWELEQGTHNDTFTLQPYELMYALPARVSDRVNEAPYVGAFHGEDGRTSQLERTEAKFQISQKMKVLDDLFWDDAAVWIAYTQQSHWQVYNHAISAPFRETDYSPEAMLVLPVNYDLGGFNMRFLNVGAVHQSNGESDPLSRSWNRLYVEAGIERGDFSLLIKPWWRIPESKNSDDNPDITDYIGRASVQGIYRFDKSLISVTAKSAFRSNGRGSVQLDYVFPLYKKLNGYVQLFSGYGESLIDYNFRQNTAGAGISIGDGI